MSSNLYVELNSQGDGVGRYLGGDEAMHSERYKPHGEAAERCCVLSLSAFSLYRDRRVCPVTGAGTQHLSV